MIESYFRQITSRAWLVLLFFGLLVTLAGGQLGKIRLDASSDSLLLQGDPDLAFFRETSRHYASSEFLILTWRPAGDLLAASSLEPLAAMVTALREIPGVSSVTSILDVPLLESPPLSLTDLSEAEQLPTLRDPAVDTGLAFEEFTTSPVYRDLLVGAAGDVSAIQVSLATDPSGPLLLDEREALRGRALVEQLDPIATSRLQEVEVLYDAFLAVEGERRSELVAEVRAVAEQFKSHAEIFVGGVPMIAADMIDFIRADLVVFGIAIIGIMTLVLGIIFRDWRWVVIPILNCSMTATIMLGLLGFLDWRMSVISSNFVAVLLIITLSLSVHVVVRYRELEQVSPDENRRRRAASAAQLMLIPCGYTALTTIVAFASLMVAGIQPVIDFGLMMTVGIVFAFVTTFMLVPALITLLPAPKRIIPSSLNSGMTVRFAGWVERYGLAVLVFSGVLVLLVAVGISRLKVENRFIDYFKESTEIYQGMELLDARLGGTIPLDIVLYPPHEESADTAAVGSVDTAELQQLDAGAATDMGGLSDTFADDPFGDDDFGDDGFGGGDFFAEAGSVAPSYWFSPQGRDLLDQAHRLVEARTETGKVLSLSTAFEVMDGLYGAPLGAIELALVQNSMPEDVAATLVRPYFYPDTDEARISVRAKETSKDLKRDQFLRELRRELVETLNIEPERVQFTSLLVLYNNVLQSLFKSQILTLGVVFLVIGLMFWVLFRSLPLALLALAPNVLAAGLVLGVMGLLGIPLDIMTITIAAIVVGIGVDDCIHYIHRFRSEFTIDQSYHAAMHRSHGSIGRAMYYTTLTVMVGFSLLTLSNFTPSLYFGLLTDLAMIAAVAGALLLLPKLILVFRPLGPEGGR
ncbi:efflux RND transporter permease subunit [Luminiphilus sp. nBUS_16]|uniref:efflux RND transporter permease subunit n=1 Tax=Luminiphilus sp. nBUS_16 TaxID=3395315 RepID=UPI003EB940AD